jgi:hypothetical protein
MGISADQVWALAPIASGIFESHDGTMSSTDHIDGHARHLLDAARAIHETVGEPGSAEAATAALERVEEALQLLSAGWYQMAADAAPVIAERRRPGASPAKARTADDGLSREQVAHLTGTLHDVASALARCARVCRDARPMLQSLVDRRTSSKSSGG